MTKGLVVDDSNSIRDMISFTLKSASYRIVETKDGLSKAKNSNFDLVILDVNRLNMDGITFLINLMCLRDAMPVIVFQHSTLTTEGADITLQILGIGALDFITKPTVKELMATQSSIDRKNYLGCKGCT